MNLSISQIRYLFVIRELENEIRVRSLDIADKLGVSKPSVHGMLEQLEKMELITKERYSSVLLTKTGTETVKKYYEAYRILRDYFESTLCVLPETAGEAAMALLGELDEEKLRELCGKILKLMPQHSCQA